MNTFTYLDFELIKLLYKENNLSQRMISKRLNCSLGKVNETLKKLKELNYLNEDNSLTNLGMNLIKKDKSAIILAAGQGIRMIPINNNVPKAMLEINGEILIERIIRQLLEANIHDITIVVGFMKEEFDYLIDQYHVKLVVNREYQEKNNLHSLKIVKDKINNTYIIPGDLYFYENPFLDNEIQSWYMLENRISKHSNVTCNTKNEIIKTKKDGLKLIGLSFINNQDASYLKEHLEHLDDGMHDSLFWEEALYQKNKMFIYGKIVDTNYVDEINTYEELRNVDDHSTHLNNETLSLIADVFKINVEQIKNIKSLKKGMTNRSFLFEINQDKYIMRIPGEGTDQLINRKEEYEVYQVIKDLNISDEVIYMNPQNGYKITKYLNDTRVCNQDDQEDLRKCMQLLKYFHQQDLKVDHEFNVFEKIDFYEKLRGPKSLYKDYDQTKEKIFSLKNIIEKMPKEWRLCHIDANCDNFLFYKENEEEKIKLIDWEYAAMQDIHLDIAMFCIYSMYNRQQVDNLIDIYFENKCDQQTRIKIYCYISMCGLLWSNWCEYKYTLGVEFGKYSLAQYRFAKDYYNIVIEEMENMK